MSYYVCNLSSGKTLDFEKKCTNLTWDDSMFKAVDKNKTCIAVIPIINVESFLLKTED